MPRIVYRFFDMREVVAFALDTLKGFSPVGSTDDEHPGLYRASHMIFIDGHVVQDASAWRPGQQINISNPVPYSRKIEAGRMKVNVPPHVYERAVAVIRARFGEVVSVQFIFMPVRFASTQDFAKSLVGHGRKGTVKARRDWLVRQPAMQITAR